MKCQILFSSKIKKNIIKLLSAELAQRMVMVIILRGYNTKTVFKHRIFMSAA